MCEPKISHTEFEGSDGNNDRQPNSKEPYNISYDNIGRNEDISFPSSPLSMKQMYPRTRGRHSQARDGRIALFVVLSTDHNDVKTMYRLNYLLLIVYNWHFRGNRPS